MSSLPNALLKEYYLRKKLARPGFSLRSFAKLLQVSPSFASGLMSGKKSIPQERIQQLSKALDLDELATKHLREAISQAGAEKHGLDLKHHQQSTVTAEKTKKYKLLPKSQFSILSHWYNIAIMDLTTCENFAKDPEWIASRLGLSTYQVEQSLSQLLREGLLVETQVGFLKVSDKIRISLNESHADIRRYHTQMIEKALDELKKKTAQTDFDLREITGITIASNPKNVQKARIRLTEALHEVAEILSEGELTELYQINAQLFSLLKK